jgi:hypothetical protein
VMSPTMSSTRLPIILLTSELEAPPPVPNPFGKVIWIY